MSNHKRYLDVIRPMLEEDMTSQVSQMYYLSITNMGHSSSMRWNFVTTQFPTLKEIPHLAFGADQDFLEQFDQSWFMVRRRLIKKTIGLSLLELKKMDIFGIAVDPHYATQQKLAVFSEEDAVVAAMVLDGTLDR